MKPVCALIFFGMIQNVVLGYKKARRIRGRVLRTGLDDVEAYNIFKDGAIEMELDASENGGYSGHIVNLHGLEKKWISKHYEQLMTDDIQLTVTGYMENDNLYVSKGHKPDMSRRRLKVRNNNAVKKTFGTKKVLVVRVVAKDRSTTTGMRDLRNYVFGHFGDEVNLVERYRSCSFRKLQLTPYRGKTRRGHKIENGAVTVRIPMNVVRADQAAVRNSVTDALTKMVGDLEKQFDHVLYCLPPGTKNTWYAYAYMNHWLSVYNDDNCNYASHQVHEVGHNLNLAHSGLGDLSYGDKVGYMGHSYRYDDVPLMCFNGAKSWQLSWYSDRQLSLDPLVKDSWKGQMVGIVDYKNAKRDQIVLLKLRKKGEDYVIAFNRNSGMNVGTQEARNEVTVQIQDSTGPSTLVATLGAGKSHTIRNYDGTSKSVVIRVVSIKTSGSVWHANISVTVQKRKKANTNAAKPKPVSTLRRPQDTQPTDNIFRPRQGV